MARNDSKAQLWAARLNHFRHSGLTISQFCRNKEIAAPSCNYWRKLIASNAPRFAQPIIASHTAAPKDPPVQFTIEARRVKIECRSDSLQAIDSLLAGATLQV